MRKLVAVEKEEEKERYQQGPLREKTTDWEETNVHFARKLDTGKNRAQNRVKATTREEETKEDRGWLYMLRKTGEDRRVFP